MSQHIRYKGQTTVGPSRNIWGDCPVGEIMTDPNKGFHFFDHFRNVADHGADQSVRKYDSFITNSTMKLLHTTPHGVIEIAGNTTDNDEAVLATHGPVGLITDETDETNDHMPRKLWFEAKFSKASIANDGLAMFVGLGYDDGSSVTVAKTECLVTDTGALGAFSFIGFHVDQADGDALNFVYKAEGQNQVDLIALDTTIEADTWYKGGFVFDPDEVTERRIAVYLDNVQSTTFVTGTNIATATFPDAEELGLVWTTRVGTNASAVAAQLDWWRFAQLQCNCSAKCGG